jgi:hypothetical protein
MNSSVVGGSAGKFVVPDDGENRSIWLVNINSNHSGDDSLYSSPLKIFGSLIE